MAEWNGNPSWTPKEQINGGQQFNANDVLSPEDFNALIENIQYLYLNGGDFDLSNYPVGTVYISSKGTSPASLFGGSWKQIKDTFLLSAGDTYVAGTTGGEAAHILTIDEMPAHDGHGVTSNRGGNFNGKFLRPTGTAWEISGTFSRGWVNNKSEIHPYVESKGGSQPHNNMPPYKAYYMWERIA